jgi:TRAP-type uncharacterized transport system fused permease subunit
MSISGSKLWETGKEAVLLGIAAFIIPFAFVLSPGLLLQGSAVKIVWAIATALVGAVLLACGIRGYAFTRLVPMQRVLAGAGGLLLIGPGIYPPLIGAGLAIVGVVPWTSVLRPRARSAG